MPFNTSPIDSPFRIGKTPLTSYRIMLGGQPHELLVKEERLNEFGSVKDRVAWYVLSKTMEKTGPLEAVIDASSGNYGNALACICSRLGIAATIVSSASISAHNAAEIEGSGARLVIAEPRPGETANAARMRVAGEIAAKEDLTFLDQYANPLNPDSHRYWTAPEVFAEGPFDACFVTASSGGTARGFSDYLKAEGSRTRLYLVEPAASCAFLDGDAPAGTKLKIPAFGSLRRSSFAGIVPDPDMIRMDEASALAAFALLHERDLSKVGLSSVGVMLGAIDWLSQQAAPSRAVCICADGDERYLDEFETRYVPSVDRAEYEAAYARLAPIFGTIHRTTRVQTGS